MKILFDIGGTKTRIAGTTDLETFTEPVVFETPKDFDELISKFRESASRIAGGKKIEVAAGDAAGPFGEGRKILYRMPSIPEWGQNIPLQERLEEALEAPVSTVNDAALVGLGEAVYGAGRGVEIIVYITVSTGVGGAKIAGGKIEERVYGFEPGWQIIDAGGALCDGCSERGYLCDYISGRAIEKREGVKPYEILDKDYWDKMAKWLAYGLNNTIVHWSPHRIVLGGSMMKEIGIQVPDVKRYLEEVNNIYPELPEIVHSELGDFGGLYGAIALLRK